MSATDPPFHSKYALLLYFVYASTFKDFNRRFRLVKYQTNFYRNLFIRIWKISDRF